ncbi:MAG: DUF2924 domain-containing protein [Planctomycetes bacterium]|nr:DUF2924 domain-containing protein [Planctomycetota bacterium]
MKSITAEINALRSLKIPDLVVRYEELFGKPPRIKHREWLFKKVAWKLQEQRFGGLPGPARRRLDEIMAEIELPLDEDAKTATGQIRRPRTPGDPTVGTTLTRTWRGREYRVRVVDEGFELEGVVHKSLSAVARAITGQAWNGPLFFGLRKRGRR